MSMENPQLNYGDLVARDVINKHGSDYSVNNNKKLKMMPLVDTVKTVENSMVGQEDLEDGQGDEL